MSISINGSNYVNSAATQSSASNQDSLSSGKRINSAADDAAGLQIANRLTSQIDSNGQAIANGISGISVTQIAQGGLESITNDLNSLRELAIQAGNGTYNAADRGALQSQANEFLKNIQDTLNSTTFGGEGLLTKDGSIDFQVSADANNTLGVTTADLNATFVSNGLTSFDITDANTLDTAIAAVDQSLESVGALNAEYGATQNAFSARVDSLLNGQVNESSARSRIEDADIAGVVSSQVITDILERSSIVVQAQANIDANRALNLLGS